MKKKKMKQSKTHKIEVVRKKYNKNCDRLFSIPHFGESGRYTCIQRFCKYDILWRKVKSMPFSFYDVTKVLFQHEAEISPNKMPFGKVRTCKAHLKSPFSKPSATLKWSYA